MGDFSNMGWSASFTEGTFTDGAFEEAGAFKGGASAIFVSEGCVADLFQNSDFTGWVAHFPEGSYMGEEFKAMGAIDDETSAIIVRHRNSRKPQYTLSWEKPPVANTDLDTN